MKLVTSGEWVLQKRFSWSEVKGRCRFNHLPPPLVMVIESLIMFGSITYSGGGIHFDAVP